MCVFQIQLINRDDKKSAKNSKSCNKCVKSIILINTVTVVLLSLIFGSAKHYVNSGSHFQAWDFSGFNRNYV